MPTEAHENVRNKTKKLHADLEEGCCDFLDRNRDHNFKAWLHRPSAAMIITLSPFYSYIHWREKEIESIISGEPGWKVNSSANSTWRENCEVMLLISFLYRETLGFND